MKNIRIIPRLDIKGPNLVKGIHLEGLRIMGKPENFAKFYYENGADELIYMDVVASLYGRNSLDEIIKRTSKETFIPLTVGGGLRNLDDIQRVLREGADKVALNTSAIQRPGLVKEAAKEFGSSTIVISIDAIKMEDGSYQAFTDNGREETGVDVEEWAKQIVDLGAGEILITSVDKEGTGKGYDIELTRIIANSVSIPVIACGGAGEVWHVFDVVKNGKADAVSMASILHYNIVHNSGTKGNFKTEGNIEFLESNKQFTKIKDASIREIKNYLLKQGLECREVLGEEDRGFVR